jgi:hypothetical protein
VDRKKGMRRKIKGKTCRVLSADLRIVYYPVLCTVLSVPHIWVILTPEKTVAVLFAQISVQHQRVQLVAYIGQGRLRPQA